MPEQLETSLPPSMYTAMLEAEGIAYFHLFDGVTKISSWANGAYQCGLDSMRSLIPGWRTDMVFALEEEGDFIMSHGPAKRKNLPLFAALKNVYPTKFAEGKNKCVVPLLIRGTGSMYEWRMNFETSLSPRIDSTTGKKHGVSKGYWSGLSGLLPQLESYIVEDVMSRGCTVEELRFVVSGHSLGGGVANVLSLWLGDRFNGSKIDLVAFASPHNFDRAASDLFKNRVNARNIAAGLDPIARLPCHTGIIESGFPRCPRGHQIVTKSGDGGREHDLLVEHRGIIHYAPEWFTQWNADWTDQSILTFDYIKFDFAVTAEGVDIDLQYLSNAHVGLPSALQLPGWHGVAYPCAFMQYCRSPATWDTDAHAQNYCVKYGLIPSTHYDQFPLNIHIFVEDKSSVAHLTNEEL
ncbi:MAG: uncharacterized protein KVP18_002594 [Porospora cf. gigantea A]|uniref:uncharacterized protein n=1 Tax=Porospora cf. gigantea A TaxID=2853593 RepID=UPI003559EA7E|nr:MAG: hypothetical protein KVP18_002594 [Porospora cf. gigantea A]